MWYYAVAGQQKGPVSQDDLVALAQSGKIETHDLVWRDGMADWLPYSEAGIAPVTPEPEVRVSASGLRIKSRRDDAPEPEPAANPADTQQVFVPSDLRLKSRNETASGVQKKRPDLALRVEEALRRRKRGPL